MRKNKFYKDNKRILNEHKTKCSICNEDAKCCLEFHHLEDKLYNISQAVNHIPTDLFILELNKCICICSNCHKKLHAGLIDYGNEK